MKQTFAQRHDSYLGKGKGPGRPKAQPAMSASQLAMLDKINTARLKAYSVPVLQTVPGKANK